MWWKGLFIFISFVVFTISGGFALADCPSADFSGDCFVDFEDFAAIGAQWLNGYDWNDVNTLSSQWLTTDPCVPEDMVYIPDGEFDMGDHHDGSPHAQSVHAVMLDSFFMSRYEITNQQYCDYLNSAYPAQIKVDGGIVYASSDSSNIYPYCNTKSFDVDSQIDYNDVSGTFSVRTKGDDPPRDMSYDPMVEVGWYGAVAYCNWRSIEEGYEICYNLSTWSCDFSKHGYRLATEAEWEYAARGGEHSPYYRFPWGNTISHSQANYHAFPSNFPYDVSPTIGYHPDWNDEVYPHSSVVGSFSENGYGLYDMAGSIWEWCYDWYGSNYYDTSPYDNPHGPVSGTYRVYRGGSWLYDANYCRVARRFGGRPDSRHSIYGIRVVLDLN